MTRRLQGEKLGLIPPVTLSRHSWTGLRRASDPRKTLRDYPRTSMNCCDPRDCRVRGAQNLRAGECTRSCSPGLLRPGARVSAS